MKHCNVDFIVDVDGGKEITILQLTDTQITDSTQIRPANINSLSPNQIIYWKPYKKDERCFNYIRKTIEFTKPDFIIITGDVVYGTFDDNGSCLTDFIDFMEEFKIPWAPVFGNHDNESAMGVDWQCEQFENAEFCLFKQRELTGNGNYTVGIRQDGLLKRVFFMLDSNGCVNMSSQSKINGHYKTTEGFGKDQIEWYTELGEKIKKYSPDTKISFAFHIQPEIFKTAYSKYGFTNTDTLNNPINIDLLENAENGDFGYIGRDLKSAWDSDFTVFYGIKALGTDSIFVGHEHCNSASVVYDGVRFQYGQKSSTYDRTNYLTEDGSIVGSFEENGIPLVGGTVLVLKSDGAIKDGYIYLFE